MRRQDARERTAGPSLKSALLIAGLALWAGAPLAGFAMLTNNASGTQLDVPAVVSVTALPTGSEISRPVALDLSWLDTPPVVAPAWSGTVQMALSPADSVLRSGDAIAQVDGIVRIAYASAVPFATSLQKGSSGTEVAQLSEFLVFRGLLPTPRTTYDSATAAAVTALAKSLGVKIPAGANVAFDPTWLVYLPSAELRVTAGTLTVGAPAPSAGTVLYETAKTIGTARIIHAPSVLPAEAPNSTEKDSPPVAEIAPNADTVVAEPAERLQVGGLQLDLDESRSSVAANKLPELSAITESGATVVLAALISPTTRESWQIPSAAVFTTTERQTCVALDSGGRLPVEVVAESRGTATVHARFEAQDRVVVDPLVDDRTCV